MDEMDQQAVLKSKAMIQMRTFLAEERAAATEAAKAGEPVRSSDDIMNIVYARIQANPPFEKSEVPESMGQVLRKHYTQLSIPRTLDIVTLKKEEEEVLLTHPSPHLVRSSMMAIRTYSREGDPAECNQPLHLP